jgi:hypothetical protein
MQLAKNVGVAGHVRLICRLLSPFSTPPDVCPVAQVFDVALVLHLFVDWGSNSWFCSGVGWVSCSWKITNQQSSSPSPSSSSAAIVGTIFGEAFPKTDLLGNTSGEAFGRPSEEAYLDPFPDRSGKTPCDSRKTPPRPFGNAFRDHDGKAFGETSRSLGAILEIIHKGPR